MLIVKIFEHPANELAHKAAVNLTTWGIAPYDLVVVGHGITEQFARTFFTKGLLPEEEFNDGLFLVEVSFMEVEGLLMSDKYLTSINEKVLQLAFEEKIFHQSLLTTCVI